MTGASGNFDRFISEQITHQHRRQEKMQRIVSEEFFKTPFKPQICNHSRKMIQEMARQGDEPSLTMPVHERLYEAEAKPSAQEKQLGPQTSRMISEPMFQPQISAASRKIVEKKM